MAIAVVLRIRSQARLHAALAAVSTPGSPQYGHYLTQSQANSLFNPTAAQQNAVVAWLSAAGFTITHTFANHLAVDARGSTRDVERTFHVSMVRYAAGSPGERYRFHAATGIPRFPARLSSLVLTILGLNDAPEPSVRIEELRHGNPPYFPQDLADAYDVNPLWANGADGIGQRIGITLDTPAPSDKTLEKWARFTATDPPTRKNGRLVIHRVDGGNKTTDDGEAGLDVEFSTGMAPGATVDFWFMPQLAAPFDYNSLNLAGTTSGSTMDRQITSSWGGCEDTTANQQGYDEMFASNATTGHDYFFPAGDNGSYCNAGAGAGDDPFPNYPASDPNVTSVGGTRFLNRVGESVNPGVYPGEGSWRYADRGDDQAGDCDKKPCPLGGGGGYSRDYPRPFYQASFDPRSERGYPDVAALADPATGVYDCDDDSCTSPDQSGQDGGTSLSTPLWAGFMADINSYLASHGDNAAGFINPTLYAIASRPSLYTSAFHEITCPPGRPHDLCTNGKYDVARGWNPVTGLGTPDVYQLALAFAALQMGQFRRGS